MWFQEFTKGYLILNYILPRVVLAPWTLANGFLFIRLPKAWNLGWNLVLPSLLPHIYLLNPAITITQIYPFFFVLILSEVRNQNVSWIHLRTSGSVTFLLVPLTAQGQCLHKALSPDYPRGPLTIVLVPYRDSLPPFTLRCAILLRPFGLARAGRGGNVIM